MISFVFCITKSVNMTASLPMVPV